MKRLFLILMLIPLLAKSQATKKDTILLKSFNKADTVVYDVGGNKLYFELSKILEKLKKYKGSNIYKKHETATLTKALKKPTHGVIEFEDTVAYDQQTGFIDTAAISNKYVGALNKIIPNMLSEGQVMIHDKKNNRPVPYLVLTKRWYGNYFGALLEYTAFLPDGKQLCTFTLSLYTGFDQ